MKCPNCGNELKQTDKFCTECGEKVEQKNISECPMCHQPISKGVIICPNCKNNIYTYNATPPLPTDKDFKKKNIRFTITFIICCLVAILVIVFAANSCTSSSYKGSNTNKSSSSVNNNTTYQKYQLKDMAFSVPYDWNKKDAENGYYFYDTLQNLLYIASDTYDYDYIDDNFYDGFVDGFKESCTDCVEVSHNYKTIDGIKSLNTQFTCKMNGNDMYMNMYLIPKNGIIYEFAFGSYGSSQSPDFDAAESKILKSINIKNSAIKENTTQKQTEKQTVKPTEPQTNKPTAKATEKPTEKPKSDISTGKANALKSAKSYLNYSAFSYQGLIDQLEYEKYSNEDAVYAVDNCGADWNEQALKSAKSYLDYSAFSYQGLIEQLEYEKFTNSEATYGADNCGADWNEQAVKSAASYLEYSSFSKDSLIDQLEYEGFTHDQAVYGAEQNGY